MKRFLAIAIAAGTALMLSGSAFAAGKVADYPASAAANGIVMSRHNLGNMGNYITAAPGVKGIINDHGEGGGTSEICVFCHTPHHTQKELSDGNGGTQSIAPAPLWNRVRSTAVNSNYAAYGTTIGGSSITTIGGVTLACLSCHDGVTAMDNIANLPGPGLGYPNERGARSDQRAGWIFQDAADARDPLEDATVGAFRMGDEPRLNIGNNGMNLSNDHPMSVIYQDDRASLRPIDTTINDIDLSTGLYFANTNPGGPGEYSQSYADELKANMSQNRWAIKGYISDTAKISDLLRGDNKVECSSCHDPHFKNLSNVDLDFTYEGERGPQNLKQDGLFLRRVGGNAGSGVCRTCHNK